MIEFSPQKILNKKLEQQSIEMLLILLMNGWPFSKKSEIIYLHFPFIKYIGR